MQYYQSVKYREWREKWGGGTTTDALPSPDVSCYGMANNCSCHSQLYIATQGIRLPASHGAL